jgi:ABC-2 type transport system ATP-binding protein
MKAEPVAPLLEAHRVSKSYGSRKALDEVDLTIAAGEFVALLGPNGAGKTTLFQLLSGLFTADAGTITIRGSDIQRDPIPALADIGIVFQQSTLDLDLSVRANLRFHARLHGISGERARRRIDEELVRLELSDRAGEPARSLSGGNRRKVELARALVHNPAVLLMDEATVGLDPASRRQMLDYVLHLREADGVSERPGVGVLWATHLVDEAVRAARVVVLHLGNVLRDTAPAALAAATEVGGRAVSFFKLTATSLANPKSMD